jgi:hypothetical protein
LTHKQPETMAVRFQGGRAVPAADPNVAQYERVKAEMRADFLKAQQAIGAMQEDLRAMYRYALNMHDVGEGDRLKAAIDQATKRVAEAKSLIQNVAFGAL